MCFGPHTLIFFVLFKTTLLISVYFSLSVQCIAGEYKNYTVTECTACGRNTISSADGADSCDPCDAGYEANTGNTQCGKREADHKIIKDKK